MSTSFLGRDDAPLSPQLWAMLDEAVLGAVRAELAGRRLLEVDGPHGLGLKSIPLGDDEIEEGVFVSASLPVTLLQQTFALQMRDLAAAEREPAAVGLAPLVQTAKALARKEDELIFRGTAHTPGLMNAERAVPAHLSDWAEVGAAEHDILAAVSALDAVGMHGPYALALAPKRYNLLLRRFATAAVSELDVVRTIATEGVIKAPVLADGGVLVQAGRQFAHVVLGQDLSLGFVGPAAGRFEFFLSESLALRLLAPQAVCVLHVV